MKRIILFGAGQNSTAMIIEMVNRKMPIDEIVFADTGAEFPETLEFVEIFKKWLDENGVSFSIHKSKLGSLYDYYFEKKCIPFRLFRHCSDKFKIVPVNKYLKKKYGKEIIRYFGIASDEKKRADKIKNYNKDAEFPLIDWNIDRKKCIDIIKKEGLPVPIKSGCYVCPFQTKKAWRMLLRKHPDLFEKAKKLEENASCFPKYTLNEKPLKDIEKWKFQKVLADKNNSCIYCETQ